LISPIGPACTEAVITNQVNNTSRAEKVFFIVAFLTILGAMAVYEQDVCGMCVFDGILDGQQE
jgi:hypothetical protein